MARTTPLWILVLGLLLSSSVPCRGFTHLTKTGVRGERYCYGTRRSTRPKRRTRRPAWNLGGSSTPDDAARPNTTNNTVVGGRVVPNSSATALASHLAAMPTTTTQHHVFTVAFPPYHDMMRLKPGQYVSSESFSITDSLDGTTEHCFRLLLYPRGGGHSSSSRNSSSTSSSSTSSGNTSKKTRTQTRNEAVGIYLQYLPHTPDDSLDVTFSLRLKGQQQQQQQDSSPSCRFDVEWSAGMRFVASVQQNLRQGQANNFGAHVMQTRLLAGLLGMDDTHHNHNTTQLQVQVQLTQHPRTVGTRDGAGTVHAASSLFRDIVPVQDIRTNHNNNNSNNGEEAYHDPERLRVGKIIVPVLRRLRERPRMFQLGAYPGVEYRILRILDPHTGRDLFSSVPDADYEIKPLYPLVDSLERPWPVRVNERDIPRLYTAGMYNAISAVGSFLTALGGLGAAFLISQAVSLFVIPSRSMDPTLQVGDVLVVDKVTPRLSRSHCKMGDVVLFSPPIGLRQIVSSNGGRISDRDLFVKRVAAVPGDQVSVDRTGAVRVNGEAASDGRRDLCGAEPLRLIERYIQPSDKVSIADGQVYVLGDCSSVSIDSRVWGPLDDNAIVGRPVVRIWPMDRVGPVSTLPPIESSQTQWND